MANSDRNWAILPAVEISPSLYRAAFRLPSSFCRINSRAIFMATPFVNANACARRKRESEASTGPIATRTVPLRRSSPHAAYEPDASLRSQSPTGIFGNPTLLAPKETKVDAGRICAYRAGALGRLAIACSVIGAVKAYFILKARSDFCRCSSSWPGCQ